MARRGQQVACEALLAETQDICKDYPANLDKTGVAKATCQAAESSDCRRLAGLRQLTGRARIICRMIRYTKFRGSAAGSSPIASRRSPDRLQQRHGFRMPFPEQLWQAIIAQSLANGLLDALTILNLHSM
jgi:hypothetical protein